MRNLIKITFVLLVILLFPASTPLAQVVPQSTAAAPVAVDQAFRLEPGNKVKLTVFGEEDLSGEFEVDGQGYISVALIGEIHAGGLTSRQLENLVTEKLKDGYLVSPRVSVEVLNFRPFFILGEVNKPGNYPYVSNLTAINAIAMAGGYTYRAKKKPIIIKREKDGQKIEIEADEAAPIYPGDTIQVLERLF